VDRAHVHVGAGVGSEVGDAVGATDGTVVLGDTVGDETVGGRRGSVSIIWCSRTRSCRTLGV